MQIVSCICTPCNSIQYLFAFFFLRFLKVFPVLFDDYSGPDRFVLNLIVARLGLLVVLATMELGRFLAGGLQDTLAMFPSLGLSALGSSA